MEHIIWPIGFRRIGLAGAAISLLVAQFAKGGTIVTLDGAGTSGGGTTNTVTVDLGTVVYGINVNASILNLAFPNQPQTYAYSQLLFNPSNGTVLNTGLTVDQILTSLGYFQNNGTFSYNFPVGPGASGTYSQNGALPSFPPVSEFPGTIGLTATSLSGNACPGSNDIGATINVDPINAADTYNAILGCLGFKNLNNGFPTSSTSTFAIDLGTFTSTSLVNGVLTTTETGVEGEEVITTWQTSGSLDSVSAPLSTAPEPSSTWLALGGIAALCAIRVRRRVLEFRTAARRF